MLRLPQAILFLLAVAGAAIWLSQTWSPSSYGLVLRNLGAADTGIVLGTPRPTSDEWGQLTPLIQATVNNGLERYNKTSFYGEDLRIVHSLPVLDWGLVFKPDKWLYPFVNAAYAYSYQWLFWLCAFVVGYALLFRRLGRPLAESAALSLVLFFTAFVQFWWMLFAPALALFPWLILALDIERRWLQFAAIVWLSACWMLGYFYPPLLVTLAYVGAVIVYRLHVDDALPRKLWMPALAALCACGLVVFYLRDTLAASASTQWPGARRSSGGGVPAEMLAQVLWPTAYLRNFETTIPQAYVNGVSVVGTYYTLFTVAFLDYARAFGAAVDRRARHYMIALVALLALLVAWQVLPIPAAWVWWTGLTFVPPDRSVGASGLAALLLAVQANATFGLRFSRSRFALFCAVVLFGWGVTKANAGGDWVSRLWPDLAILPIAALALLLPRRIAERRNLVAASCCALWGALAFGGFNPLQSAWPIFNREPTPMTRILDYRAQLSPDGTIAEDKFGAILNGWGYRSVAHVLLVPPLAQWHRLFPDLDPATFDEIFNRYAFVVPIDEPVPRLVSGLVIGVPRRAFEKDVRWPVAVEPLEERGDASAASGQVESVREQGDRLRISGWAPWHGLRTDQKLIVRSNDPLAIVHFERVERPDRVAATQDPSLVYSGFAVDVEWPGRAKGAAVPRFCLAAQDRPDGPRVPLAGPNDGCP